MTYEYHMTKECAKNILKIPHKKGSKQKVLCDYVNSNYGLKGICIRVIED